MSHFQFAIDHFDRESLNGWVDNAGPVSPLSLFVNDRLVGEFPATDYRSDLEVAGFGDGRRGFDIPVRQHLQPGLNHLLLRGEGRDILDDNLFFDSLRFSIDCFDRNGLTGWVDASGPASPLSLYINDALIGDFDATSYRADLEDAGIGDGHRGFHIRLSHRLQRGLNRLIFKWQDRTLLDDYLFQGTWPQLNEALPPDQLGHACGPPSAFVTPMDGQEFVGPNFTVIARLDGTEKGAVCRVFSLKEYVTSKPSQRHVLSETVLQPCAGDLGAWSGQIGHLRTNQNLVFVLSAADERVLAGALARTVEPPDMIVRVERPELHRMFGEIVPPQGDDGECRQWHGLLYQSGAPDFESNPAGLLVLNAHDLRIIGDSNGYFPWWFDRPQKNPLVNTSLKGLGSLLCKARRIASDPATDRDRISGPSFLLTNAYTGWNFGHDLSTMLFALHAYENYCRENDEVPSIVVNPDRLALSPNTVELIELHVPRSRWVEVRQDRLYEFDRLVIPPNCYMHLHFPEGFTLQRKLLSKIRERRGGSGANASGSASRNVILCKLEGHKAARKEGIMPEWVIRRLTEGAGQWQVLDPEKTSYFEIALALDKAEQVILGSGGIQYAHRGVINPEAKVYRLFHSHNYPSPLDLFGRAIRLDLPGGADIDASEWDRLFEAVDGRP